MAQLTRVGFLSAHGGAIPAPPGDDPMEIVVNAVNFDGTNDYLTRDGGLTGAADSKTGILSFWTLRGDDNVSNYFFANEWTAFDGVLLRLDGGSNKIFLNARNTSGGNTLQLLSTSTLTVSNGWVNILASWDLSVPTVSLYVNDVDVADTPITLTDAVIDYTNPDWSIGSTFSSGNPGIALLDGDMAELYFQDGEFLDLTVTANRRKFISAGGKPIDLGANGSDPTGTQPLIYLSGDTATWHTNKGSGGGFTEVGALTTASSSPSD